MFHLFSCKKSAIRPALQSGLRLGLLSLIAATVSVAAQAEQIGYATGRNLSYALCRKGSEAIQFSQFNANNTWLTWSSTGVTQVWTEDSRDDHSVYLHSTDDKQLLQIDTHLQICNLTTASKGTTKTYSVDTIATTAPRPAN